MSNPTKTFSALAAVASKQPQAMAIVHQEKTLSYRELFNAASGFADKLEEAGLTSKGVIGLVGSKDIEFVIAFLALLRRGNPVIPLSPALQPAEIVEMAGRLSLSALCYSEKFAGLRKQAASFAATISKFPTGPGLSAAEIVKFPDCSDDEARQNELARRRIASIRLSSGTTGEAKGIMISEEAIWWRAECTNAMHDVTAEDCILYIVAMDLASPHLIAYFSKGAKAVVEEAHNFAAIHRLCGRHKITHVHATPLFYQMMINQSDVSASDFSAIKFFISTGAPLPTATAASFGEKFGREISQYYGLGECGPVFVNVSNDRSKRGAAGVLLPDWEINFPGGKGSDAKDRGELFVRGPGLFDGYYEPWMVGEAVLFEGWFRTGDLARRDEDGYFWIVGRSKDLINVGGTKVFPAEIEDLLMSHPDVEGALVYGRSDARFGEVPHAKVKRRAGASITKRDLVRFVNGQLPILKKLRHVEFVTDLPRTGTGKIKRGDPIER
jgi:acyl-CoA synthetase (AMP-forming)/AMP-acid ligase II